MSVYNFEAADVDFLWKHFAMCEEECTRLLDLYDQSCKDKLGAGAPCTREKGRFPLLAAYELCLKCSHLFNLLDARGAISVTERVGVIGRIRQLAVRVAGRWIDQQAATPTDDWPNERRV
jgi:glycyl-tRNA synthetase alpha chain